MHSLSVRLAAADEPRDNLCLARPFSMAAAFLEKFGGDSLFEITRNLKGFLEQVRNY